MRPRTSSPACVARSPPAPSRLTRRARGDPVRPVHARGFQCGALAVPLDPSGAAGGALTLNIRRRPRPRNPTNTAVIGARRRSRAGGDPVRGEARAEHRARRSPTRDLLVFDQRGTGVLGRAALLGGARRRAGVRAPASIGPARAFYRTAESVEDIEAIRAGRRATRKLVLYGTSYGTKVAEAYAAKYPANVEALVLDSVVLPEGPDVFDRSTLRRVGPRLRQLCGTTRCRGITGDPRGDVAALVRRLARSPLRGPVVDATGPSGAADDGPGRPPRRPARGRLQPDAARRLPGRGAQRPARRRARRSCASRRAPRASTTSDEDGRHLARAVRRRRSARRAPFPWPQRDAPQTRADAAVARGRARSRARSSARSTRASRCSPTSSRCASSWPNARPRRPPPGRCRACRRSSSTATPTCARRSPTPARSRCGSPAPSSSRSRSSGTPSSARTRRAARAPRVAAFFAGQTVQPCTATAPQFPPTRIAPTRLSQVPGRRARAQGRERRRRDAPGRRRGLPRHRRRPPQAPRVGTQIGGLRAGTARWTATGDPPARASSTCRACSSAASPRDRDARTTTRDRVR